MDEYRADPKLRPCSFGEPQRFRTPTVIDAAKGGRLGDALWVTFSNTMHGELDTIRAPHSQAITKCR